MTSYYLVLVWGGVDTETLGPFTIEGRDEKAREFWSDMDPAQADNIFKLDINPEGPGVIPYLEGELES